jgi:hypothetical protein
VFGVSSMFSVPIDHCSFLKGNENIEEVKRSGISILLALSSILMLY